MPSRARSAGSIRRRCGGGCGRSCGPCARSSSRGSGRRRSSRRRIWALLRWIGGASLSRDCRCVREIDLWVGNSSLAQKTSDRKESFRASEWHVLSACLARCGESLNHLSRHRSRLSQTASLTFTSTTTCNHSSSTINHPLPHPQPHATPPAWPSQTAPPRQSPKTASGPQCPTPHHEAAATTNPPSCRPPAPACASCCTPSKPRRASSAMVVDIMRVFIAWRIRMRMRL